MFHQFSDSVTSQESKYSNIFTTVGMVFCNFLNILISELSLLFWIQSYPSAQVQSPTVCKDGTLYVSLKCHQSTRSHTNLSPAIILPGIFAYSNKGKYWWANILADSQINISTDSPLTLSRVPQCPPGRITLPIGRNVYYDLGGNQFSGLFDLSQIFIKTY